MLTPTETRLTAQESNRRYWQKTRRLTTFLLCIWFGLTFGTLFFAHELDRLHFFYWPLSFYMAAQGLTLIFVLLLAVYSLSMRHIDDTSRDPSL
jgi:putative solute:sodium symporter small subunit